MRLHDYQRTLLREKFLSTLAASVNDVSKVFCDKSHVNKFNTYYVILPAYLIIKGFFLSLRLSRRNFSAIVLRMLLRFIFHIYIL